VRVSAANAWAESRLVAISSRVFINGTPVDVGVLINGTSRVVSAGG
jgi:hypothetical protein